MALTWTEIITRVKQNVEDINLSMYSSAEIIAKVNEAKDDVLGLVKIYSDEYPLTITTVTFAATDTYVEIKDASTKVIKIEDAATGFQKWSTSIVDPNKYDKYSVGAMANGSIRLFRTVTGEAETLNVYTADDVADLSTATSTATFTFGPKPADNLIVVKATIKLLITRNRSIGSWVNREGKLEDMLMDTLGKLNVNNSRHVNYVPEDY